MYERYRTGKITREKFADIQYKDAQEVERLTKRAVEIEELISKRMEEREKRGAGEKLQMRYSFWKNTIQRLSGILCSRFGYFQVAELSSI
jgi:hypothetical protein